MLLRRETLYRSGGRVGWPTSGGYGHTVRKGIGYGDVRNSEGVDRAYLEAGKYEWDVADELVPSEVRFGALYDPGKERVKG